MERTQSPNPRAIIEEQEEPIVLSKALLDTFLRETNSSDLIALYIFYYYTAKWQRTNKPKITTKYVCRGLKWGRDKTIQLKNKLIKLGLIENITRRNPNTNTITGHFIKVNFIWSGRTIQSMDSHPTGFPTGGDLPPVVKPDRNSLPTNRLNALSPNNRKSAAVHYSKICSYLRPEACKREDVLNAIQDFVVHRYAIDRVLTAQAITLIGNKLAPHPPEVIISAINQTIESGWTSIFPEKLKVEATQKSPDQIISERIQKDNFIYVIEHALNPLIDSKHVLVADLSGIAAGLCNIYDWYDGASQRPKFHTVPETGSQDFQEYCVWNRIPYATTIVSRYAEWILSQEWLDEITAKLFDPKSKVFQKFFRQIQDSFGLNFLNGSEM